MTEKATSATAEFLGETEEMLEKITHELALVEKARHSAETLNSIYRDVHTIKGTAQLFGCLQMAQMAHSMETCLEPLRSGALALKGELVDALYAGLDVIKKLVESLKRTQREVDVTADLQRVVPRLGEITSQLIGESEAVAKDLPGLAEATPSIAAVPLPPAPPSPPPKPAIPLKKREEAPVARAEAPTEGGGNGETIRVQVNLLDNLMNLVGELVLIRNQLVQYASRTKDEAEFTNLSQRLNIVTTELQNEVMKTRMQPIGNILSKFQRIVRDMARELGKEIDLKLEGVETELDKTLIEAVKDPLTHIVRNSVDHGIEMPEVRRAAGKGGVGQVLIRSFHEGGQVVVEVVDNGRGLSRQKIGGKAVEKGLITAEALDKMSEREVHNLIFLPGFSTADKVSNISGRGVGMDVVRTNIEKIGGVVDLTSTEGAGMAIRLKIPLTLAIVPALIVQSGGERFAIPQVKLVELVRIDSTEDSNSGNGIQMLQGQPVFRLRGSLLSLVSLNGLLSLPDAQAGTATNIAVLNADSGQFGLIVDAVEDSTDIVVKPLNPCLKDLRAYSGATVLGDGSVALVLDVIGLAAQAHIFDDVAAEAAVTTDKAVSTEVADDLAEYLVVDVGVPGRYAIPLCLVSRLEEFKRSAVEMAGDQRVVRYRESILPLLSVPDSLALSKRVVDAGASSETVAVVVVERGGRAFGLEVDAILDVITIASTIDAQVTDRPAILGTTFHVDGVVVVIDAFKIIDDVFAAPGRSGALGVVPVVPGGSREARQAYHLLVAEDNSFFRNHIEQILVGAGFRVTVEVNGEDALTRLQSAPPEEFALLLSDIEMPKMTGLQLAERVRANERFRRLPMVALTTKTATVDQEKGLRSGFDKYLAKLNGEQLITELDATLGLVKGRRHGT